MLKALLSTLLVASCLIVPLTAQAEPWPDKAIKLLVPFNPGGGTDQQARLIEKNFLEEFGQVLNFIYKPGADGAIGATELSHYPADGYSIAVHTFPLILMNTLTGKGRYSVDDFDYLAVSNFDVAVLVTRKESPYTTLEQFLAAAKANPDKKLTVGVVEVLGPSHIAALKLLQQGVPMNIVTMAGGAKGTAAVLGGHLDALFTVKGATLTTSNKLNILAVATEKNDVELPGVPTFLEKGLPVVALAARIWIAPKGLPADVKTRFEEGFRTIYTREDTKERLANAGQNVSFGTGEEVNKLIADFRNEAKILVKLYKDSK